jgi:hypothetical protein
MADGFSLERAAFYTTQSTSLTLMFPYCIYKHNAAKRIALCIIMHPHICISLNHVENKILDLYFINLFV